MAEKAFSSCSENLLDKELSLDGLIKSHTTVQDALSDLQKRHTDLLDLTQEREITCSKLAFSLDEALSARRAVEGECKGKNDVIDELKGQLSRTQESLDDAQAKYNTVNDKV